MVQFRALGPVEAVVAGRLVCLGAPKQRALLALLVSRVGQPVAVDVVVDALWAGHPPPSAMTSLQAYVANLRRVLEPDRLPRTPATVLLTCPGGYLLDSRVVDTDVRRFGERATAGWQAWDRGDPQQALTEFEAGLALWRGQPYSEVANATWVVPKVARLEELRLSVVEKRALWLWEQVLRAVGTCSPQRPIPGPVAELLAGDAQQLADGTDVAGAALRRFEAIVQYLTDASDTAPLVVLLDHLHRADQSSLRMLAHLAESVPASRLLVAVSYRPGEAAALAETLAALARAGMTRIELNGLTTQDTQILANAILHQEVSEHTAEGLRARTEGNPFFLRELIRLLTSEQRLDQPDTAPVPVAVRQVVLRRVARLPPAAAEVLSVAAIAGRHFDEQQSQLRTQLAWSRAGLLLLGGRIGDTFGSVDVTRRQIMQAPSGQLTAPALQAMLADATFAGDWTLDGAKSTIGLRSRSMWGLVAVKGVFGQVTGQATVSPAGEVSGTIKVGATSIETKNAKRDNHLRSDDFFAAETFPHIIFSVDRAQPSSEGVTVTGELTVRDRTRPLTFPAKVCVADSGEVLLDAVVQVNRSEFGLVWNQLGMTSMQNTIFVHAVFSKS